MLPRRSSLFACVLVLGTAATVRAQALTVAPGTDHTAYRADVDVFGWNNDFSEMGCIASDVQRYRLGKQRGNAYLLVYRVGEAAPIHKVQILFITQADLPHAPVPMQDVRDIMWGIDEAYQRLWRKRPKRKHYAGAMKIEMLWQKVEMSPGQCVPAVGFLMQYRGAWRYQEHVAVALQASCDLLRETDTRIYWGKTDVGAAMVRFDYSPSENEASMRFPFSVAWRLGGRLAIRVSKQGDAAVAKRLDKDLERYGDVTRFEAMRPSGVRASERGQYVARRIAADYGLDLELDEAPTDPTADVEVVLPLSRAPSR